MEPLPFADFNLDRATHVRGDGTRLAALAGDARARFVPVWRNRNLLTMGDPPEAVLWSGDSAALLAAPDPGPVFLGLLDDGAAVFAVDVSRHDSPPVPPSRVGAGESEFVDLRTSAGRLDPTWAGLLAYARGLMFWHRRHRFCGACGAATAPEHGGHVRRCQGPACGHEHFPRTDSAVIMLVTAELGGEPVCLLGRQRDWPDGLVSTLAGFLEPGETLEQAVAREVFEEAGIRVADVTYQGSQPWPFPASIMLGFRARALDTALVVNHDEIELARWVSRAELHGRKDSGLFLPGRHAIARRLIDAWLAEGGG